MPGDKDNVLYASQMKVRYYDTALSKAVFFVNHIKWFDSIAINDFLHDKGVMWGQLQKDNMDAVVASVSFDYKAPIYLNNLVDITVEGVKVGNKSICFTGSIYNHNSGEVVGQGSLVYVFVDCKTRKTVRVPDGVRTRLEGVL